MIVLANTTYNKAELSLFTSRRDFRRWPVASQLREAESGVQITCVRMQVQGLGRGCAAVRGAAGLGCFAVMAQYCARAVELLAAAVQQCMQRF